MRALAQNPGHHHFELAKSVFRNPSIFNYLQVTRGRTDLAYTDWRGQMHKLAKSIIAALALASGTFLIQACSRPVQPQEACNFVQNSQFQRVSWKNEYVNLYLDATVPPHYVNSVKSAAETWNTVLGKTVFHVHTTGGGGQNYEPAKDNYSKIYFLNTWDADRPNEQARTTVYWQGANIYEADVRINNYNFDFFTTGDATDYSKVHLESLLIHEFGHVLGLAHTHDSTSVMQVNLANGYLREQPGQIDLASLKCEY
jgi:predicted Zn-dependent protease